MKRYWEMKILYSETFSSNVSSNLIFDSRENYWNASLRSWYSSVTSDMLRFWMIRYWYFNFSCVLLNVLKRLIWENESSSCCALISLLLFWFERYEVLEMTKSRSSKSSISSNSSKYWDIILKKTGERFIIMKWMKKNQMLDRRTE